MRLLHKTRRKKDRKERNALEMDINSEPNDQGEIIK